MSKKILLIDDDLIVKTSVAKLLRLKGYEVLEAADGSEGVEVFQKNSIDLVIIDMRMPGLNGIETIEALRSECARSNKKRPAEIILTGYSEKKLLEQCTKIGINEVVFKPFNVLDFVELISRKFS